MKKTTHYKDPIGHGGLDRTKRLINAAIRLWELRQESPQYSSSANLTCDGSENQSNRLLKRHAWLIAKPIDRSACLGFAVRNENARRARQ